MNAPFDISDRMRKEAEDLLTPVINEDGEEETEFEESTFRKIMEYEGQRDAVSNYVCEDGSIKMTVIAWAAKKGIDISGR